MKTSDFAPYTGKGPLPYSLRILGVIKDGDVIPEGNYKAGDAWFISPEDLFGMVVIFFDGTQFRYPKHVASACTGTSSRSNDVQYIMEYSFMKMFKGESE